MGEHFLPPGYAKSIASHRASRKLRDTFAVLEPSGPPGGGRMVERGSHAARHGRIKFAELDGRRRVDPRSLHKLFCESLNFVA
jgi:hypothetical protein